MKIQDQVCTLEQAKKLKELGVEQESLFYYIDNMVLGLEGIKVKEQTKSYKINGVVQDGGVVRYYSAFTVAELGELLPIEDMPDGRDWQQRPFRDYYPHTGKIMWKYDDPYTKYGRERKVTEAKTEAEARAAMLIYLLENNLMPCTTQTTPAQP